MAITAYSDEARARAAGFDHHFVKPADPHAVEEMLRKLRAIGKRLDQTEELVWQQGEVVAEARDVMKEVKEDVKELRQDIQQNREKDDRA